MSDIVQAITKLRPNSEYSFVNEDYATIKWDVLIGSAPTQAEIDTAIKQIGIEQLKAVADKAAAKTAAQAKLAALGLTTDDLKALGL